MRQLYLAISPLPGSHLPVVCLSHLVQGSGLSTEIGTLHELGPVSEPQFIHLEKGNYAVVLSQGLQQSDFLAASNRN